MALPGNLRDVTAGIRASVPLAALALMLSLAACGDDEPGSSETAPAQTSVEAPVATGPAATEASPAAAAPAETAELADADEAAVTDAVNSYIAASLGYSRPGGTPVWKQTTIKELKEVSVGPDRARVTASVVHQFADRQYPSVEDDVIYLDRFGDAWLLAKPSGTLYRAVGYPEPPLRALTPPPG